MKLLLAALVVLAPLAGCVGSSDDCPPGFPLVLRAYPQVGNASLYEFQSTLWNCTDRPIPLDEPCGARDGLVPRVVIGNETLVIGRNFTAIPRDQYWCFMEGVGRSAAQPGDHLEQRYAWDGTARGEPVPSGAYRVFVEAGDLYEPFDLAVPWNGSAFS